MNLHEIRLQRTLLQLRIAHQRSQLEQLVLELQSPASLFDKGYALAHKVRQHPLMLLGGPLLSLLVFRKLPFAKVGVTALITLASWWRTTHKPVPSSSQT